MTNSASFRPLIVLVWALIAWPTLDLPWSTVDDPLMFVIADRIERAPMIERLGIANRAGTESYPGRCMPLYYFATWAWFRLLGHGVLAHRIVHLLAFLGLALWIRSAVMRAGGRPRIAVLSALGFLIFAGHYEVWLMLVPTEPMQVVCTVLFFEALLPLAGDAPGSWHPLAAAFTLAAALAVKETSFCLGLPLFVTGVLRWRAAGWRGLRPIGPAWVVYLGALAIYLAIRPGLESATPTSWTGNYRPTPEACLATLSDILAVVWKTSGPLVAVGLAGLALRAPQGTPASARALPWLACAWALGGLIIFLPWRMFAPRHMLWISVPLTVAVGIGIARLAAAPRPLALAGAALGAASLAWMSAQYGVTMSVTLARYRVSDGPFTEVVQSIATRAPARGRVLVTGGPEARGLFETFLKFPGARADLTVASWTPQMALEAGDLVAVRGAPALAPTTGLTPVLAVFGRMEERDLPEPRYCLSLILRAARETRVPAESLMDALIPRLFTRTSGYTLFECRLARTLKLQVY